MTLNNQFLIATPAMKDDFFKKSVIYICEHNKDGAIGLIVNHPLQRSLQFVFDQMKIDVKIPAVSESNLMIGGPLRQEHGFVIHRDTGETWRSSLRMPDGLCVTTSHDILEAIADGTGPTDMMLLLGYAGWDAGQIEEELASNSWLTCPANNAIIFNVPSDKRWEAAGALLGVNMNFLSTDTGHA